jgi:hypothetical protein
MSSSFTGCISLHIVFLFISHGLNLLHCFVILGCEVTIGLGDFSSLHPSSQDVWLLLPTTGSVPSHGVDLFQDNPYLMTAVYAGMCRGHCSNPRTRTSATPLGRQVQTLSGGGDSQIPLQTPSFNVVLIPRPPAVAPSLS